MKSINRRLFVKQSMMFSIAATLLPYTKLFAAWPEQAFKTKDIDEVLTQLYGESDLIQTQQISIKAPNIAENGAVVPIYIESSIKNLDNISLFVEKNPNPLAAAYKFGTQQHGMLSTRVKLGDSSNVIVVARAEGKLYSNKRFVKVTIGGCGGG